MVKSVDALKGIISGWASVSSAWNDSKSKYVEENVISVLDGTINEIESQLDEIAVIAQKTEEKLDEIERIGDGYGW